jgi:hypothetical protein
MDERPELARLSEPDKGALRAALWAEGQGLNRPGPGLSALVMQVSEMHSSDGALANRFRRVHTRLDDRGEDILTCLRGSRLIGRDATGARGHGRTPWAWVFQQAEVCGPVMRPRRGQGVIQAILGAHRPTLWASALSSAQRHLWVPKTRCNRQPGDERTCYHAARRS